MLLYDGYQSEFLRETYSYILIRPDQENNGKRLGKENALNFRLANLQFGSANHRQLIYECIIYDAIYGEFDPGSG